MIPGIVLIGILLLFAICLLRAKDRAMQGEPLLSLLYLIMMLYIVGFPGILFYKNFTIYACRAKQSSAVVSLKKICRLQQKYYDANARFAGDLKSLGFESDSFDRYEYYLNNREIAGITTPLPEDGFLAIANDEWFAGRHFPDTWLMDHRNRLMNVNDACLKKRADPDELMKTRPDNTIFKQSPIANFAPYYMCVVVGVVIITIIESVVFRATDGDSEKGLKR